MSVYNALFMCWKGKGKLIYLSPDNLEHEMCRKEGYIYKCGRRFTDEKGVKKECGAKIRIFVDPQNNIIGVEETKGHDHPKSFYEEDKKRADLKRRAIEEPESKPAELSIEIYGNPNKAISLQNYRLNQLKQLAISEPHIDAQTLVNRFHWGNCTTDTQIKRIAMVEEARAKCQDASASVMVHQQNKESASTSGSSIIYPEPHQQQKRKKTSDQGINAELDYIEESVKALFVKDASDTDKSPANTLHVVTAKYNIDSEATLANEIYRESKYVEKHRYTGQPVSDGVHTTSEKRVFLSLWNDKRPQDVVLTFQMLKNNFHMDGGQTIPNTCGSNENSAIHQLVGQLRNLPEDWLFITKRFFAKSLQITIDILDLAVEIVQNSMNWKETVARNARNTIEERNLVFNAIVKGGTEYEKMFNKHFWYLQWDGQKITIDKTNNESMRKYLAETVEHLIRLTYPEDGQGPGIHLYLLLFFVEGSPTPYAFFYQLNIETTSIFIPHILLPPELVVSGILQHILVDVLPTLCKDICIVKTIEFIVPKDYEDFMPLVFNHFLPKLTLKKDPELIKKHTDVDIIINPLLKARVNDALENIDDTNCIRSPLGYSCTLPSSSSQPSTSKSMFH